jgi:hypothetical protein
MHRTIRSYVLRQGRVTPAQERACAELYPRDGLAYTAAPLDAAAVFGRRAPLVFEIGSGMGDTTAEIAAAHPENDYLAAEVHLPGVGALLKRIAAEGIANLRVIRHDALEVLQHMARSPRSTCSFPIPGRRSATTSAAWCSRRLPRSPRGSSRPAACCMPPPTGQTTPSRCRPCCRPKRCWSRSPRPPRGRRPGSSAAA